MAIANDEYATVFKNGTITDLARTIGEDGAVSTQVDISSGVYSIYLLDDQDADSREVVSGHDGVSLTIDDVIFNELQTDVIWTKDDTGYNFKHVIDISSDPVFTIAGRNYLAEYTLTPESGQVILVRFRLNAI